MLILGLDTSSPAVSVALLELLAPAAGDDNPDCGARAQWQVVGGRRHGELLATGVAAVLGQIGADRREIGAVAVGVGPGPFTGLRVGIVTGLAFADALGVPAYGVCSLDAIAAAEPDACPGVQRLVVTDARRREVYWARYDEGGHRVAGPSVQRPDLLAAALPTGWTGVVVGEGARLHAPCFDRMEVLDSPLYPSARAVVGLAADRAVAGAPSEPLTPLYLRRPDAVAPSTTRRVTA